MDTEAACRWSSLLAQADRSELTIREFAHEVGVNPNTLAWWKWKLGRMASERDMFVELEVGEVDIDEPEDAPIWLEFRNGVGIEVTAQTDLQLLRTVVEALC